MTPYLFRLASGDLGIRDATGCRAVNGGELEGPFNGETVWDVPPGSPWESWVTKELDRYFRSLEPVVSQPVTVKFPTKFSGTLS